MALLIGCILCMPAIVPPTAAEGQRVMPVMPDGPGWFSFVVEGHPEDPMLDIYVEVDLTVRNMGIAYGYTYNASDPFGGNGYENDSTPYPAEVFGSLGEGGIGATVETGILPRVHADAEDPVRPKKEWRLTFRFYGSISTGILVFGVGNVSFHEIRVIHGIVRTTMVGDDVVWLDQAAFADSRTGPSVSAKGLPFGRWTLRNSHEAEYTAPRPFYGELRGDEVTEPDGTRAPGGTYQPWATTDGPRESTAGTYRLRFDGLEGGEPLLWAAAPEYATI